MAIAIAVAPTKIRLLTGSINNVFLLMNRLEDTGMACHPGAVHSTTGRMRGTPAGTVAVVCGHDWTVSQNDSRSGSAVLILSGNFTLFYVGVRDGKMLPEPQWQDGTSGPDRD